MLVRREVGIEAALQALAPATGRALEAQFWAALSHRKLRVSFRRQVPPAGYICDCVRASHRLLVQVGGAHRATGRLVRLWLILCLWRTMTEGGREPGIRSLPDRIWGLDRRGPSKLDDLRNACIDLQQGRGRFSRQLRQLLYLDITRVFICELEE